MSAAPLSPAAMRIVAWLGEVGPRWGLPANACQVHGLLYLRARPCVASAIAEGLGLGAAETQQALDWLAAHRLVEVDSGGWRTGADPWELVMRALDTRRAYELGEARAVIDGWRRDRGDKDPLMARQAERLFALVDDVATIEAGARRLSPATTRRLIGLGGRAARLLDRAIGAGGGRQ